VKRSPEVRGIDAIVGYAERNRRADRPAAAQCGGGAARGQVRRRHFKTLLPTYDVFDESRYFEPGPRDERANLSRSATKSAA
jgi:NAD+ synthase (glutamine-hydrolysing)